MKEEITCCNKARYVRAFVVILGIWFPAHMCIECGEVFDDVQNPLKRLLLKILNPFWSGEVMVDEETFEIEKFR